VTVPVVKLVEGIIKFRWLQRIQRRAYPEGPSVERQRETGKESAEQGEGQSPCNGETCIEEVADPQAYNDQVREAVRCSGTITINIAGYDLFWSRICRFAPLQQLLDPTAYTKLLFDAAKSPQLDRERL
jgi:hypothetical protein